MTTLDPSTGLPLPPSTIQRVLFTSPKAHIYAIPPLTSTRGFHAAPWTAAPRPTAQHIFTARVRVLETSADAGPPRCDVVLEDPTSGDLFAAAPYSGPAAVQAALDSSRFFAVRVVGVGGMRATLGLGFEERSEAVDFGIALADERKVLGWEGREEGGNKVKVAEVRRDWGLKEGESIVVEIGGKGRRVREGETATGDEQKALFSIAPPPGSDAGGFGIPPPPPPAGGATRQEAQDLGFDDGEFGEFQ